MLVVVDVVVVEEEEEEEVDALDTTARGKRKGL
jgi:hypothetical protein